MAIRSLGFRSLGGILFCAATVFWFCMQSAEAQSLLRISERSDTRVGYSRLLVGNRPGRVSVNKLIYKLRNGETAVRIRAASSLGRARAQSAVKPLIASLSDSHYWVRRAAAKSLGQIRAKSAVPYLRRSLRDSDRWVAHSAANALRRISSH